MAGEFYVVNSPQPGTANTLLTITSCRKLRLRFQGCGLMAKTPHSLPKLTIFGLRVGTYPVPAHPVTATSSSCDAHVTLNHFRPPAPRNPCWTRLAPDCQASWFERFSHWWRRQVFLTSTSTFCVDVKNGFDCFDTLCPVWSWCQQQNLTSTSTFWRWRRQCECAFYVASRETIVCLAPSHVYEDFFSFLRLVMAGTFAHVEALWHSFHYFTVCFGTNWVALHNNRRGFRSWPPVSEINDRSSTFASEGTPKKVDVQFALPGWWTHRTPPDALILQVQGGYM